VLVYFNTVRRKRPVAEAGELIKLDWNTKKIIAKVMLFPSEPDIMDDPNPRGNTRGGKGILLTDTEVYVGTYHTILVFDLSLRLKRRITHPLFVNLHEMSFHNGNIWVSATAIDGALLVDQAGRLLRSFWPREEKLFQEQLGLVPLEFDKAADNRLLHYRIEPSQKVGHTHLNSVFGDGRNTFALLKRFGTIIQLEPHKDIFLRDPLLRGTHSPTITSAGDRLVVCGSMTRDLLFFDLAGKRLEKRLNLLDFPEIAALHGQFPDEPFNQSIFVRGLVLLDQKRALVGISPASILEVNLETGSLLDFYQYSREVGDAIHGLACDAPQATPAVDGTRG